MCSKDGTTRLVSTGCRARFQNGLISALGIPPEDFFQVIHVLPRSRFRHTPSFLGLSYSDDLILLEVTFYFGSPHGESDWRY